MFLDLGIETLVGLALRRQLYWATIAWARYSLGSELTFHMGKQLLTNQRAQEGERRSGNLTFPDCPRPLTPHASPHLVGRYPRKTVIPMWRKRKGHFDTGPGLEGGIHMQTSIYVVCALLCS
jgi:hypothetical protein